MKIIICGLLFMLLLAIGSNGQISSRRLFLHNINIMNNDDSTNSLIDDTGVTNLIVMDDNHDLNIDPVSKNMNIFNSESTTHCAEICASQNTKKWTRNKESGNCICSGQIDVNIDDSNTKISTGSIRAIIRKFLLDPLGL